MTASRPVPAAAGGLREIADATLDEALRLLAQGFPDRDRAFWLGGFARLDRLNGVAAPRGYLLGPEGSGEGVLLTFRSERVGADGRRYPVVNLAGWYVTPGRRGAAPLMLRRAVADTGCLFTDLTPSPALERINPMLGFITWNGGEIVAVLPALAALGPRRGAEVRALGEPGCPVPGWERGLLEGHVALGCLPAVLHTVDGGAPLLFRMTRRRGIGVARLAYAPSRRAVLAHRGAVARFLRAHGALVLLLDADRDEVPRDCLFRQGRRRFFKGPLARDRIDYAASELVLLDLGA